MVYHNEPLPPPYDQFEDSPGETIALALEIVANGENTLRLRQAPASPSGLEELPPGESLLRTMLTGAPTTIRGERHLWQLERVGALD